MSLTDTAEPLPGIDAHPHARAVLGPALAPGGRPSHAYLFHGPAGAGKRTVARAFAAALLGEGAPDPGAVAARVARDAHPDLTWVRPSGAAEMLVSDIDAAVIAAAAHTPFESTRRLFVIEGADTMNDQAANRMLKTLEEPASYVHLILIADRPQDLLPTIVSRCQPVRFDPPSGTEIAARLRAGGTDPQRATACARLSLGDARLARRLAGDEGAQVRRAAEEFVRAAVAGEVSDRPWTRLLEAARAAGTSAATRVREQVSTELEFLPERERRRHERDSTDAQRRAERRARTGALDLGLRLSGLWLRDAALLLEGPIELVYAVDRVEELRHDATGRGAPALREGLELIEETRRRLALNVSEELALEAVTYRLAALLGP